jgi:anti-anti-sigma regulatory factor
MLFDVSSTGSRPLSPVVGAAPYVLLTLTPTASRSASEIAAALADTLAVAGDHLVVDLTHLRSPAGTAVRALAAGLQAARRAGRAITLVRCSQALATALWAAGLRDVAHAPSLASATAGRLTDEAHAVDLFLRSEDSALERVRQVAGAVAAAGGGGAHPWTDAVAQAAAHAIEHGSPEGPRNHIRVSFAIGAGGLVVDVSDQSGDTAAPPPPLPGLPALTERLRGREGNVLRLHFPSPAA